MPRVRLKGLHVQKKRLADGTLREYHYAWRGGPRLKSEPGTAAYVAEFTSAHNARKSITTETIAGLVLAYRADPAFRSLRETTKPDYERALARIVDDFGTMPTDAASANGARKVFLDWRNAMADRPRTADRHWAMIRRVFSWAVDQEIMPRNPCAAGGKLYRGTRRDIVWSDSQVALFLATAPSNLALAMRLAVETGQRQGDLLALKWSNIADGRLSLRQSKSGRKVSVLIRSELIRDLERVPRISTHVLTSSVGRPWTKRGFSQAWKRACDRAGIEGVTFHDLRGTAVVHLAGHGASVPQIASITGHSLQSVERILEEHYLAEAQGIGDAVVLKMERSGNKNV